MITVYIAAASEQQEEAVRIAGLLERSGIVVTSEWINLDFAPILALPEPQRSQRLAEEGLKDLKNIDEAAVFLLLNPESFRSKGTGGRHVEFGYALARKKLVIVYGEQTNVFHYVTGVHYLADPGDIVKYVGKLYRHSNLYI